MTVVVTWFDGTQETYACESVSHANGVLTLFPSAYSEEPRRSIPVRNVKIWTEQK